MNVAMAVVLLLGLGLAMLLARVDGAIAARAGCIAWIASAGYVVVEYVVAAATTAPFDPLRQPMSDLGVTECGSALYPLAPYEICSPLSAAMNWAFALAGLVIAFGAICLHASWPRRAATSAATTLLVVFGLSFAISGVFPANEAFVVHTVVSLPGMVVQIPALLLLSRSLRTPAPALARWSSVCAWASAATVLLLVVQPLVEMPGGLVQRMLYAIVVVWAVVTALAGLRRLPSAGRRG